MHKYVKYAVPVGGVIGILHKIPQRNILGMHIKRQVDVTVFQNLCFKLFSLTKLFVWEWEAKTNRKKYFQKHP